MNKFCATLILCLVLFNTITYSQTTSGTTTNTSGTTPAANANAAKPKKIIGREPNERIKLNFKTGTINPKVLPFDVPFTIYSRVPPEISAVGLTFINKRYASGPCGKECQSCVKEVETKENADCPTNTCNLKERDKHCTTICGWKLNYFSALKTDKAQTSPGSTPPATTTTTTTTNTTTSESASTTTVTTTVVAPVDSNLVVLEMPPLRANQEYQFTFKFQIRPLPDDVTSLKKSFTDLMRARIETFASNQVFRLNGDFTGLPAEMGELQPSLVGLIQNYYASKLNEQATVLAPLLQEAKIEEFKKHVTNAEFKTGPRRLETILRNIANAFNFDLAQASTAFNLITDANGKTKKLLSATTSVKLTPVLTQLAAFDPTEKDRLVHGRINFSKNGGVLDQIQEARTKGEVKPYVDNVLTLIAAVDNATTELTTNRAALVTAGGVDGDITDVLKNLADLRTFLVTASNELISYGDGWQLIDDFIAATIVQLTFEVEFASSSLLSSTNEFETRTEYYVSADLGLAYVLYSAQNSFYPNQIVPYFGVNFNFAPINRQKTYSLFESGCFGRNLRKNTSAIVGLTVNSLAIANRRDDSFDIPKLSLLTGMSLRVSDAVRVSGGFVWNRISVLPALSSRQELRAYPFVSVSFDLDVAKYLGYLGDMIFPNTKIAR